MEGYFPIHIYCELTGITRDTAFHRAERQSVPAFKNEYGTWFLFYSDEGIDETPTGYLDVKDFAVKHNTTEQAVRLWIMLGKFKSDETMRKLCRKNGNRIRRWFIKEDAVPNLSTPAEIKAEEMNKSRPEGYLTVPEWAREHSALKSSVYSYIRWGRIEGIKIGKHWYIHKDTKWPTYGRTRK